MKLDLDSARLVYLLFILGVLKCFNRVSVLENGHVRLGLGVFHWHVFFIFLIMMIVALILQTAFQLLNSALQLVVFIYFAHEGVCPNAARVQKFIVESLFDLG